MSSANPRPLSEDLMAKLAGEELRDVPYYGIMETKIGSADVVISQTGFTGEKGYEFTCEMHIKMLRSFGVLFLRLVKNLD